MFILHSCHEAAHGYAQTSHSFSNSVPKEGSVFISRQWAARTVQMNTQALLSIHFPGQLCLPPSPLLFLDVTVPQCFPDSPDLVMGTKFLPRFRTECTVIVAFNWKHFGVKAFMYNCFYLDYQTA